MVGRRFIRASAIAVLAASALNVPAAGASPTSGQVKAPYTDAWTEAYGSCSGSAVCSRSGSADQSTGVLSNAVSVDVPADASPIAEDGSGYMEFYSQLEQDLQVRGSAKTATVTVTLEVTRAAAAVSGDGTYDVAESDLWFDLNSANCYCSDGGYLVLAESGSGFARPPGEYTVRLAVSVPGYDTNAVLGLLRLTIGVDSWSDVDDQHTNLPYVNGMGGTDVPTGAMQARSASASASVTIKSIKLTQA